ncbi:uncharacterized protein LOC119071512 [Bradysia coprophila]|uniref:uncharacterized protein LOC119071512 n=1 Tax=Bradysia coprophila TaxID=38358 RepID=UPI00187DBDC8|nr:uncharacterized protein LOC119071512 [Bradysia coprophila]
MDLIEKMRRSNFEQFVTLVRMHLSFELDLNTTDDNDVVLNEKLKSKKRFNFHKKAKICTTTTSPLCSNSQVLKEGILQLRELIKFLVLEQNITQEGIFRRTGSLARQNDLKSRINNGLPLNLEGGAYTVHDCASVFKGILSELPEPLLTDTYNVAHVQIAELCNNLDNSKEPRLVHSLQLLLLLLPPDNYNLLKDIIEMLHRTTEFVASNKMSASSLATLFTPHLICPKKLTPEALHQISQQMSGVISFMISKGTDLFDIPPNLAIDIRAYFVKEQQKALSPEHFLDESVTSDSIANTVYTFVDKERTAQACVSGNPTDTALAQLYAHIQTLPESSKKRKLIKQFNKENGQGTPLQMLNRLKNTNSASKPSKSLGDSIKRHIFHKSLATKSATKQRSSPAFHTPTRAQQFTPKSRQLFQSPYIPRQLQSDNNVQLISSKLSLASPSIDSNKAVKANHKVTAPVCTTPIVATESLAKKDDDENLSEDEVDSFELLSETLNRLQNTSNCSSKKTVAFNVATDKCETESEGDEHINKSAKDFKSFHKSEPDLSKIYAENAVTTPLWNNGRFITSKLMKGVSMVNLKCPSFIDRKILRKSSSIQFKRKSSTSDLCVTPCKENSMIDDEDFEETPNKDNSLNWSQESHLRRRSMSPITKSTQRMSKAMQESIMTPRSRKPVMLIGASLGSSDQRNYHNSFSSLREEDEESSQLHALDTQEQRSLYRSKSAGNLNELDADNVGQLNVTGRRNSSSDMESLSAPFREYLLSRSVCTSAPVDASFSSQPDDFGSTEDIQDLTETELSQSLLYCLNGNIPADMSSSNLSPVDSRIASFDLQSRKRTMDVRPGDGQAHKRMLVIKNVLLEHPGETSL